MNVLFKLLPVVLNDSNFPKRRNGLGRIEFCFVFAGQFINPACFPVGWIENTEKSRAFDNSGIGADFMRRAEKGEIVLLCQGFQRFPDLFLRAVR